MKGLTCTTCFERATTLRKGKPSCKRCFRLTVEKWEAALFEVRQMEATRVAPRKVAV